MLALRDEATALKQELQKRILVVFGPFAIRECTSLTKSPVRFVSGAEKTLACKTVVQELAL